MVRRKRRKEMRKRSIYQLPKETLLATFHDRAFIDDVNEFLGVAEDWSCEAPRRKRREHTFAEWEAAR